MQTHTPLISIVMPAFNTAAYIRQAIESVVAQTYPHWELLIVDDGSTDSTADVVATFSDPRLRFFQLEHVGYPSRVRNYALRQARGEYFAFLDSDDAYMPDALASLLTHLQKTPNCIAVHGFDSYMDSQGEALAVSWNRLTDWDEQNGLSVNPDYRHTLEQFLGEFGYCQIASLLLPRKTMDALGFFDETLYLAEDKLIFLKLFLMDETNFHYIPKLIYQYRIHESGMINDKKRFQKTLDNIPQVNALLHATLLQFNHHTCSLHELATRQYRWCMSSRLSLNDYSAFAKLFHQAFWGGQMRKRTLLVMSLKEGVYRFSPHLLNNAKRFLVEMMARFSPVTTHSPLSR